jgi:hypothetical protein
VLATSAIASAAGASGSIVSCSTRGLSAERGRAAAHVVGLSVDGLTCRTGRAIAGTIARDLSRGEAISIAGASSYSMSEISSCTSRCASETEVSVGYPRGSVKVSLGGALGASGGTAGFDGSPTGGPGLLTA